MCKTIEFADVGVISATTNLDRHSVSIDEEDQRPIQTAIENQILENAYQMHNLVASFEVDCNLIPFEELDSSVLPMEEVVTD